MKKYCSECGTELHITAEYCSECGTKAIIETEINIEIIEKEKSESTQKITIPPPEVKITIPKQKTVDKSSKLKTVKRTNRKLIIWTFAIVITTIVVITILALYPILQESSDWSATKEQNNIPSYIEYLGNYPEGKHKNEAVASLEMLMWDAATNFNSIFYYEEYLRYYPEGKHFKEAKDKIEKLNLAEKKLNDTEQFEIKAKLIEMDWNEGPVNIFEMDDMRKIVFHSGNSSSDIDFEKMIIGKRYKLSYSIIKLNYDLEGNTVEEYSANSLLKAEMIQ